MFGVWVGKGGAGASLGWEGNGGYSGAGYWASGGSIYTTSHKYKFNILYLF